MIEAALRGKY